MKEAIFFERDGVLNEVEVVRGQQIVPRSFDEFKIAPGAAAALQRLKDAGFLLLVVTNQPGVSRGYLPRRELDLMHTILRRKLPVDDLFLCAHDEMDHCTCRKPEAGLLTEAAFKHHLSLEHSFVVSDKWQDAQAAQNAGCTSLLLKSPWNGKGHHDFIVADLNTAVDKILALRGHFSYGPAAWRVA
ncbi:MAG: HAD-IIIA family hydrolase [Verrucomicrobia bacterium]|nr:HAD-IIIA family hydrolase [Verrucomicrobiota bacterium]